MFLEQFLASLRFAQIDAHAVARILRTESDAITLTPPFKSVRFWKTEQSSAFFNAGTLPTLAFNFEFLANETPLSLLSDCHQAWEPREQTDPWGGPWTTTWFREVRWPESKVWFFATGCPHVNGRLDSAKVKFTKLKCEMLAESVGTQKIEIWMPD